MKFVRKSYKTKQSFCWQPIRNIGFTLGAALRRVVSLREGGPTTQWIQTALYVGRYVGTLQKQQGWKGVVIRFKACGVLLQQCAGGHILENPRQLGCAISRSRQGLPRIIPVGHRKRILSGDTWSIRIWASFFWLYRVIDIPGKIKLGSIMRPFEVNYLVIMEWVRWLVLFFPVFLKVIGRAQDARVYVSKRRSPLSENRIRETSSLLQFLGNPLDFVERLTAFWVPSTESSVKKSLPRKEWRKLMKPVLTDLQPRLLAILNSGPNSQKGPDESPGPTTRTSIGSILTDALLWMDDSLWARNSPGFDPFSSLRGSSATTEKTLRGTLYEAVRGLWPQAAAFAVTFFAQAKAVHGQLREMGIWDGSELFRTSDSKGWSADPIPGFSSISNLGKLGFVPEPAGKIRVVAMVDSLTQMLLRPLHDAVFGILQKIPQDGTFDQLAPARLLAFENHKRGVKEFFSYDLSAATDRFPVSLQQALLGLLIGPMVALQWRKLLTFREYTVPRNITAKQHVPRGTPRLVKYMAGQPMGAYTSWAVFALTHHFLVQFAAYQAGKGVQWFSHYCLLGDDVVIGDRDVAQAYLSLLQVIGVEVGLAKSLISEANTFEFAKRTFHVGKNGDLVDISGISLDMIGSSISDISVMESLLTHIGVRSPREGLVVAARVLGYGFRTRSSFGNILEGMNPRLSQLVVLLTRPRSVWGLPFTHWLLQTTVGVPGIISDDTLRVLEDAVRQRLVDSAKKLVDVRLGVLNDWGLRHDLVERVQTRLRAIGFGEDGSEPNPQIETAVKSFPRVIIPHFLRNLTNPRSPLYEMFLSEWVFKPIMDMVTSDIEELLYECHLWAEGKTSEGNFSLDEIYLSINRLVEQLSAVDTAVNMFIRRSSKERSKNTKLRSRAVKLWKASRKIISGTLTR